MELLGFNIPINLSSGIIGNTITIVVYAFLGLLILGAGWFAYYYYMVYKFKIEVFENLGGNQYRKVLTDRGRLVKMGDSGEEIMKLWRSKKLLPYAGKKMDKNLVWFAIGQDNYWYNVTLGDLDAKRGMLDIEPVERDVRYAQVAIRRNLIDRYRKVNFMDKYGSWIIGGVTIVILLIGVYFLLDKMGDNAAANAAAMETGERVLDVSERILGKLDSLMSGGSGLKPASVQIIK